MACFSPNTLLVKFTDVGKYGLLHKGFGYMCSDCDGRKSKHCFLEFSPNKVLCWNGGSDKTPVTIDSTVFFSYSAPEGTLMVEVPRVQIQRAYWMLNHLYDGSVKTTGLLNYGAMELDFLLVLRAPLRAPNVQLIKLCVENLYIHKDDIKNRDSSPASSSCSSAYSSRPGSCILD